MVRGKGFVRLSVPRLERGQKKPARLNTKQPCIKSLRGLLGVVGSRSQGSSFRRLHLCSIFIVQFPSGIKHSGIPLFLSTSRAKQDNVPFVVHHRIKLPPYSNVGLVPIFCRSFVRSAFIIQNAITVENSSLVHVQSNNFVSISATGPTK